MVLTLNDDLVQATRLSEQQILQELAVALFRSDHLTLAQAARLAQMDRLSFQHLLAGRGIPIHYGESGYEEDLRTLSHLAIWPRLESCQQYTKLKHAKLAGWVSAIAPLLLRVETEAGFWIGGELRRRILREAGE